MTPLEKYQKGINAGELREDPQQFDVVKQLNEISIKLHKQATPSLSRKIKNTFKKPHYIQGIYLWGNVGTGKTMLIDLFYHNLEVKKLRIHFFEFLQNLQKNLNTISGEKNPLQKIAKHYATKYKVICFDEFFVKNIADAMLLGELFKALFDNGVCLIATSNRAPDDLYKDGLQRDRFIPAIEAIKKHTHVIHLLSENDYRKQHIEEAGIYYTPLSEHAEREMEQCFRHFSQGKTVSYDDIQLLGRTIKTNKYTTDTVWFDFKAICKPPRSQQDYLALTEQFDTFLISNIHIIKSNQSDIITLFIALIDILYDKHKNVIISAETTPNGLYPKGILHFEYARTCSRLIEMQSKDYINLETK